MQHIGEFIKYLEIERCLSRNTISVYNSALEEFGSYLGRSQAIGSLARSHIRGFLCFLAEKNNQPITRRLKLTALKMYFGYLCEEKIIQDNPARNLPAPKVAVKEPEYLTASEIKDVIRAVKKEKGRFKKRNELIVRVLAETGIRLSELVALDVADIDVKTKTMKIIRKGNISQSIPVNAKLMALIGRYVKNKNSSEALLESNFGRRITPRRVGLIVTRCLKKAGINKPGLSCHSFRHSFCVRLLEQGTDIRTIQILAGHKRIETTAIYLHIAKAMLRKEVKKAEID